MPSRPARQGAIVTAWREMGRSVDEPIVTIEQDLGAVVVNVSSNVDVTRSGDVWTAPGVHWVDVDTSFGFEVY